MDTFSRPITLLDMPIGPVWEEDGSCWKADVDPNEEKGWRWFPMNWRAFAKETPEGEMHDAIISNPKAEG